MRRGRVWGGAPRCEGSHLFQVGMQAELRRHRAAQVIVRESPAYVQVRCQVDKCDACAPPPICTAAHLLARCIPPSRAWGGRQGGSMAHNVNSSVIAPSCEGRLPLREFSLRSLRTYVREVGIQ